MSHRIESVKDLGLALRAQRKSRGLRLEDVATSSDVGHVFARHAEHGKDSIHLGKVLQVLATLGLSLTVELDEAATRELERLTTAGGLPLLKSRKPAV